MFSLFIRAQFQHDLIGVLECWSIADLSFGVPPFGRVPLWECGLPYPHLVSYVHTTIFNPESEIKNRKALDQHGMPVSNFRT